MPSLLDYAEAIIGLEKQAAVEIANGLRHEAAESLRCLLNDVENALKQSATFADTEWLQNKRSHARAALRKMGASE